VEAGFNGWAEKCNICGGSFFVDEKNNGILKKKVSKIFDCFFKCAIKLLEFTHGLNRLWPLEAHVYCID
jgi:hypothetical protein